MRAGPGGRRSGLRPGCPGGGGLPISADAGEVEIPDYLLNPNMEMPEIQILQPGDVEEMLSGGWALTLFTCTLGGRTRVTVRCEEAADAGRSYGLSI